MGWQRRRDQGARQRGTSGEGVVDHAADAIARAKALSVELGTPITPGFEALVFKASRGIEDIYELTYIRKDGSRFPAVVSVTALRDAMFEGLPINNTEQRPVMHFLLRQPPRAVVQRDRVDRPQALDRLGLG